MHRSSYRSGAILAGLLLFFAAGAGGCQLIPKKALTSEDIPSKVGTSYIVWQNAAGGQTSKIDFDLEGPWDFSTGPKDTLVKSVIVNKTKAAGSSDYKGAAYAEKVLPADSTDEFTLYNYVSKSKEALCSYGQSATPGPDGPIIKTYDKPERLLRFPVSVGASWRDTIKTNEKETVIITIERTVVARGQMTVPAGTFFNCFMVRVKRTIKTDGGEPTTSMMYIWYAPDVGPVAAVGHQSSESTKPFKEADYVFRLRDYKIAD